MADEPTNEGPDEIIEEKVNFSDTPIPTDGLNAVKGPLMTMTYTGDGEGNISCQTEFHCTLKGRDIMASFKTAIHGLLGTALDMGKKMGASPEQVLEALGLESLLDDEEELEELNEDDIDGDDVVDFEDGVDPDDIIDEVEGEVIEGSDVTGGPQDDTLPPDVYGKIEGAGDGRPPSAA